MRGHGERKFTASRLLASSASLRWPWLAAEVRTHVLGPIPAFVTEHAELTLILRSDGRAVVHRAAHGARQHAPAAPGTSFLIPAGTVEEATYLTDDIDRVLHLYLSRDLFRALDGEEHLPRFDQADINYVGGISDAALVWLGEALARELAEPTPQATLLVQDLGLSLAERIIRDYTGGVVLRPHAFARRGALDARRLRRVLDFIEAELASTICLEQLAAVACLSPFHFARAFRHATGQPPHRYLQQRRFAEAKRLLRGSSLAVTEVALACGYSSPSNFTRAFTKAVGAPPRRFRQQG